MFAMSCSSCLRKASSSKSGDATPVEESGFVVAEGAGGFAGGAGLGLLKSSRTSVGVSVNHSARRGVRGRRRGREERRVCVTI